VENAFHGRIVLPGLRKDAAEADEEEKGDGPQNEAVRRKREALLFVGFEGAHYLRSRSPDYSVPETAPTPFVFHARLSKKDCYVITELLRKKLR
jgi:hypothetical protein